MARRHHYRNPPVEEALCEFRFEPGRDWNLTIPGRLQAVLGEAYSGRPREQRAIEVDLGLGSGPPSGLQFRQGLAKVQLVTADGKRSVGVGKDSLSVHMLRPYQRQCEESRAGWDEFKLRISEALDAYWKVARPKGVRRVGVRYINKLVIPSGSIELEDYLVCGLPHTTALPETASNFVSRVEYAFPGSVRLILTLGTVPASREGVQELLVDIDVIREDAEPLDRRQAISAVEELRARERMVFESVITDKARRLFDAD